MKKLYQPSVLATGLLTIYQLIRIIVFVNVYGGLEHDGGWMLSISRSLAEAGTYTTLVSTLADPAPAGGVGVDQKFDIQTPDGRIWFFTGNGVGPTSIIPDALILKIFGSGFWALRAGPLIFYTLFLLLAAYSLYRLAGLGAVFLFHAYLFFYPHLSIFLGYEAMGEVPGMVYILAAYLIFWRVLQKRERRRLSFFGAGLAASLAINAKLITLWSLSSIFAWGGLLWAAGLVKQRSKMGPAGGAEEGSTGGEKRIWPRWSELLWLGGGFILPALLWEAVQLLVLTRLADFELYQQHAHQRLRFILDDGSGLGLRPHTGAAFLWDKFFLLSEAAHPARWATALIFGAILLGGLFFLWRWRRRPDRQNLLALLWIGWLANTVWFVSLAKTGWPRHFWFGLILAVLLLGVISGALATEGFRDWQLRRSRAGQARPGREGTIRRPPPGPRPLFGRGADLFRRYGAMAAGLLLLGLVGWGFVVQPHVWGFFVPEEIVAYWRAEQIDHKYGANLPWIIIPRRDQAEVVRYLRRLPPEAKVYYPAQHKAAEITPQVGRVFYPLARRRFGEAHPQDVTIIGPSLIAPWMDPVRREALLALVREACPHPHLANDYYMICPLPAEQ